jgi:YD repeat-containing protein
MVEVMFGRRAGWLLGALVAGTAFLASAPAQAATGTRVSAFEYDPVTGQLTKEIIEPDQPQFRLETNYTLDAFGNRIAATVSSPATGAAAIAPRTNTASYDAQGRFAVASTNALGHTETKSYDARFGVVTSVTGPNGLTTTWSYDSFGRKVLETRADGTKTKWEYLFCNGVQGGTIPCPAHAVYIVQTTPLAADGVTQNGPRARAYVDALGREVRGETQGFDGNPVYVDTEHDTMGRVYRKSRPYVAGDTPQWTTFTYDAIGRPLSTTEPNGAVATTAYDGLSTTYTDPLGQYRTIVKNSQGWVISVSEGKGSLVATTSFLYDAHGNQIQSTDATGKIATATYDVRGHKTAAVDPDMGSWTYVVDVLGQVKSQTDAKNQTTTFAYDLLGRMIQRVAHDGETATWTYDTATKGIGKIAEEVSSNGFSRTYTYDSLGRPGQVQTTIDGSTYTFDRTYDAHGRLDTVTYPNLYGVRQVYTALGYLQQVENKDTQAPIWTANTVDAEGHITQFTQGNGVVTNRTYEATTGRLTAINAAKPGTPATEVVNLEFAYDNRGNMIWRQDALIERREAFTYDALNRLAEVQVQAYGGGSAFSTQSLTYDLVGNITSKSNALLTAGGSGTVQATATYEYVAGTNRLTRLRNANGDELVTFAYDNNGHITQSAQGATAGADARMFRTYQWTATNLVARVDRGGGYEAFTYGPDGQPRARRSTSAIPAPACCSRSWSRTGPTGRPSTSRLAGRR